MVEKCARLRHGCIRVIGRKHDAIDADLKQQIEKRGSKIKSTEGVMHVFAKISVAHDCAPV